MVGNNYFVVLFYSLVKNIPASTSAVSVTDYMMSRAVYATTFYYAESFMSFMCCSQKK